MKIGVIQATSQKDKNELIYNCVKNSVKNMGYDVINFGVFEDENEEYSYIHVSICICMLLESKAIDFIVTGCSSGQGMMLACNSMPGVLCGYIPSPQDAYLFGRINNGNVASLPLGLNFGWAGEINLQCTLDKLFDEPFGKGYSKEEADRKIRDTEILKNINSITKKSLLEVMPKMNENLVKKALERKVVYDYIMENGQDKNIKNLISRAVF